MIKFSFEVPIAYMKKFDKVNDYHFILAHMLVKDKKYAEFYKRSRKFKILDNGCAELGESIDVFTLISLAKEYKVDMIVLPDVWMDGKKTLEESTGAFEMIKRSKLKCYVMYVTQGKSYSEFLKYTNLFINRYKKYRSKIVMGLPYLTCAKLMNLLSPYERDDDVTNARIQIIQKTNVGAKDRWNIHLLGAGFNYTQEISFMRHYKNIVTTDTSTPFILAKQGIKLDPKTGLFERVINKSGTLDFYEKYDEKVLKLAMHNANVIKSFAKM